MVTSVNRARQMIVFAMLVHANVTALKNKNYLFENV